MNPTRVTLQTQFLCLPVEVSADFMPGTPDRHEGGRFPEPGDPDEVSDIEIKCLVCGQPVEIKTLTAKEVEQLEDRIIEDQRKER